MYLIWQDLDTKRPIPQKIADACARYQDRFGVAPNVALVHPSELAEAVVQVQARINVRPGTYWVGVEALPSMTPPPGWEEIQCSTARS